MTVPDVTKWLDYFFAGSAFAFFDSEPRIESKESLFIRYMYIARGPLTLSQI